MARDNHPIDRGPEHKPRLDGHLTDELLLLAADGELPPEEEASVQEHLKACWSCRVRQEQIEQAIAGLVEFRDHLVNPHLPRPIAGRTTFMARVQQFIREAQGPTPWARMTACLKRLVAKAAPIHPLGIANLIIAILVVTLIVQWNTVKTVSASELLERAYSAEASATNRVARPVVYRKLRIRSSGRATTLALYENVADGLRAEQTDPANGNNLREMFRTAQLNWEDPLSARAFANWHRELTEKKDDVNQPGEGLLLVKTTVAHGPIAAASLTVRSADYHAIAASFWMRDGSQVEVDELGFNVMPFDEAPAGLFTPKPEPKRVVAVAAAVAPLPPVSVAPLPPVVTEAELEQAELRVWLSLHTVGADLGEPLEVSRNNAGDEILVHGLANSDDRKDELLASLQDIPHVASHWETVTEAVQEATGETPDISKVLVVEGKPLMEEALEKLFPEPTERAAFVDRALSSADDALAHAWALRRLEERYRPSELAKLDRASQQMLKLLLRDHVAAVRRDVEEEHITISRLIAATPSAVSASDDGCGACFPAATWRGSVKSMLSYLQDVRSETLALLANTPDHAANGAALLQELEAKLRLLAAAMPRIYEQVNGDNFFDGTSVEGNNE
jgi:anti-sigma factor RsiW